MNTLLLIQKSLTFLTLTFTLSLIPKQVMAVPDITYYAHQADTNVGTSLFQSLSEKYIFSTIICKKETEEKEEKEDKEPENRGQAKTSKGAGAR